MSETAYYSFLIRKRLYCDRCLDAFTKATTVRNVNGKDLVLCAEHASRLDAARKSDAKQNKESDCHADAIEALEQLEAAQDFNQ
jgi:hypothetical protein